MKSLRMMVIVLVAACTCTILVSKASAQYTATNLVSNTSLYAPVVMDPNLVDGWGLAALPNSPWWVSAQNTSKSTLDTGSGSINPLVVNIPCVTDPSTGATTPACPLPGDGEIDEPNNFNVVIPGGNASCTASATPAPCCTGSGEGSCIAAFSGGPAGLVANSFKKAFEMSGKPAQFIFSTQDGLIVAWNSSRHYSGCRRGKSILAGNRSLVHILPGLAIAGPAHAPHLYATNIFGEIDVFDKNFNYVDSFPADSNLPTYTPFTPYGIQTIGKDLYVTYFAPLLPPASPGAGILDVCDLSTSTTNPTCKRLAASNLDGTDTSPTLNSPWGLALAPHNFGPLGGNLLVGNLDDGLIHAFDPKTGALIGTLNTAAARRSRFRDCGLCSSATARLRTVRAIVSSLPLDLRR